ncbi:TonB-dependent receptor plug domain-containing protein [Hugenholtzia roseola]|uniref:TonB-dependent receptor plug domain-containing protein n=1 Tax=Hugenholtzia roseola TaxID=1002 RepID=UPI0003F6BFFA|nr:TonB-dependent receptor [Hugenholtzia roseola]
MFHQYRFLISLCAFLSGLSLPFSVEAQLFKKDTSLLYQLELQELQSQENTLDVEVVSASKISQKISDAPNLISFFNQKQIHQYGWLSLGEMLTRLPTFALSQDYDRKTVSSRGVYEGWNNNHLLLLIDGVQCNDNLYGTAYTWEITPLVFNKSVEILRGSGSALYGSNAVNGAINLSTLSPDDLRGIGMAQFRFGNQNTRIYDIVAGVRSDYLDGIVAFNTYTTDGSSYRSYDDSERTDEAGNPAQFDIHNPLDSRYFFTKLQGRGKFEGFSLQFHDQKWSYGSGHGWLFNVPDQPENLSENRRILAFKYNDDFKNKRISQEYILRYQRHGIDWNMRYFPDGALENFYPFGVTEYLKTQADDLLLRSQYLYKDLNGNTWLGGVEGIGFFYRGDKAHFSNVNLNEDFAPFADNRLYPIQDWLSFVKNKPVWNLGVFVQYISPFWIGEKLQLTASLRYDNQFFEYRDVFLPDSPELRKSFSQLSPRLGLVFKPIETLTLKALYSRGFRTPSPTEMFGTYTYSLASNLSELEPERINSYEIQGIWRILKGLNTKLNFYLNDFDNIIAYSTANANLSTNIYSLHTAGVEAELELYSRHWAGFLNYTYTHRLDEQIVDSTVVESPDLLTWYPAHRANLGVRYQKPKYHFSLQVQYQSAVERRSSDFNERNAGFRPQSVPAWVRLNTKVGYRLTKQVEIGCLVTNITNGRDFLIKNNAFRMDYQMAARRVLFNLLFEF